MACTRTGTLHARDDFEPMSFGMQRIHNDDEPEPVWVQTRTARWLQSVQDVTIIPWTVPKELCSGKEMKVSARLARAARATRAHVHTCTRAHVHTCTRASAHTCTRAHVHPRTRAHVHTCTRASAHTCIRAHVHTCIRAREHPRVRARECMRALTHARTTAARGARACIRR